MTSVDSDQHIHGLIWVHWSGMYNVWTLNIILAAKNIDPVWGGGWVRQRCRVSYVTGASNWYWLTVGQGLLTLQQVRIEGNVFLFPVSSLSFIFLSLLSLSFILIDLFYLFSPFSDETRRSRVQPPPRSATFFHGDWSWNIFYSHNLPSADSRRAVVSFWQKNVHNTG